MTPSFTVHATSHYERLSSKLQKSHRDFEATESSAVAILSADPYNRSQRHVIKKLEGVPLGEAYTDSPSADGAFGMTSSTKWFSSATVDLAGKDTY